MAIGDITFEKVCTAISECNEVGELKFLERYVFFATWDLRSSINPWTTGHYGRSSTKPRGH